VYKRQILHDGKITNPEAIKLFDAKLLTTTSSEHFAKIDLERSEPKDFSVGKFMGLANAFVTRPACKTCGLQNLDEVSKFLEEHQSEDSLYNMDFVTLSYESVSDAFERYETLSEQLGFMENKEGDKMDEDKKSLGIKLLEAIGLKPKELLDETEENGGKEKMTEEEKTNLEDESKETKDEKLESTEETKEKLEDKEEKVEDKTEIKEKLEETKEDKKVVTLEEETLTKMMETLKEVSETNKVLSDRLEKLEEKDHIAEVQLREMKKEELIKEILGARDLLRNPTTKKTILERLDEEKSLDEHIITLTAERDGLKAALSALPEGQRPVNATIEMAYEDDGEKDEELQKLEEEVDNLYQGK
jgi:hypothetical protein